MPVFDREAIRIRAAMRGVRIHDAPYFADKCFDELVDWHLREPVPDGDTNEAGRRTNWVIKCKYAEYCRRGEGKPQVGPLPTDRDDEPIEFEDQNAPDPVANAVGNEYSERLRIARCEVLGRDYEEYKGEDGADLRLYDCSVVSLHLDGGVDSLRECGRRVHLYFEIHHPGSKIIGRNDAYACQRFARFFIRLQEYFSD